MKQATAPARTRLVEIVVPVHNEQRVLGESVRRLHSYLTGTFPYGFRITIADNASTDATWPIATDLSRELSHVRALHLDAKGRGRALRGAWSASDADVVSYMDVDLSTDLDAFLPLVAPLLSGHSDLAIGTRLSRGSNVVRGPNGSSSRGRTTCCSARRWGRGSPTRSAVSRRSAPRSRRRCSPPSRTRSGSSTPSCCSSPNSTDCASTRCP